MSGSRAGRLLARSRPSLADGAALTSSKSEPTLAVTSRTAVLGAAAFPAMVPGRSGLWTGWRPPASCGAGRAGVSRGRGASAALGDSTGAHRGLGGSDRAWPGLQPRGRWLFAAPRPRARSPPRLTAARAQPLDPPGKFPQPPPPTPAGTSPAPQEVGP